MGEVSGDVGDDELDKIVEASFWRVFLLSYGMGRNCDQLVF